MRKARLLLGGRKAAQILLVPGEVDRGVDVLERLVEAVPAEGRAQHRPLRHDERPRLAEAGDVQRLGEDPHHLLDVHPRPGGVEGVEQHARLHR